MKTNEEVQTVSVSQHGLEPVREDDFSGDSLLPPITSTPYMGGVSFSRLKLAELLTGIVSFAPPTTAFACTVSQSHDGIPMTYGWDDTNRCPIGELAHPEIVGDPNVVIAPAIFRDSEENADGCRRIKENHQGTYAFAFDADNPACPPLRAMREYFSQCDGIYYTTKSHQKDKGGVVCDRYRMMIPYSRPATHIENKRVHNLMAQLVGHDPSCGDGTRLFYGGSGAEYGVLGGKLAIDLDVLLDECDRRGITESRRKPPNKKLLKRGSQIARTSMMPKGTVNEPLRRRVKKIWTEKYAGKCEVQEHNTRDAVWAIYHYCFEVTNNLADILATLQECDFYSDWLARKHEDEEKKLIEAFASHYAEELAHHAPLHVVNKVYELDSSSLPPLPPEYQANLDRWRQIEGYQGRPDQDITHRLILEAVRRGRANVDVPCGCEKSVGVAVGAATYATLANPYWVVCEHHKACLAMIERLELLGAKPTYVPGYRPEFCEKHLGSARSNRPHSYYGAKSLCRTCKSSQDCLFGRRVTNQEKTLSQPLLVMSHAMYLVLCQRVLSLTPQPVILVDEQLRAWEQASWTPYELDRVCRTLSINPHQFEKYMRFCTGDGRHTGTGICDSYWVDDREYAKYLGRIHSDMSLSDEDASISMCFLQTFRGERTRYVMYQDGRLCVLASKMAGEHPEKMVMLDASARYTQVQWPGFDFLTVRQDLDHSNLTLHVKKGNPTKSSMERSNSYREYWEKKLEELHPEKLFVAVNKGGKVEVDDFEHQIGCRGTDTRGSNDYLECDVALIAMSLFTEVSDYALRASLATGEAISCEHIWDVSEERSTVGVQMRKSGWVNDLMHHAFLRQVIDEVYQAIMRIAIRKHDGKTCAAILQLPAWDCVEELLMMLPGAKVVVQGFGIEAELGKMSLEELVAVNPSYTAGKTKDCEKKHCARTYLLGAIDRRSRTPSYFKRCMWGKTDTTSQELEQVSAQQACADVECVLVGDSKQVQTWQSRQIDRSFLPGSWMDGSRNFSQSSQAESEISVVSCYR